MECNFVFHFNKKRQWVEVYLWDVHPNTFERWGGGRWCYFHPTWEDARSGKFGELHFVKKRFRYDGVHHELLHMWIEWFWEGGETVTRKNEERLVTIADEIARNFRKALEKAEPGIKL